MKQKVSGILLLGGDGKRFGSKVPKQFLCLPENNEPLFATTAINLFNNIKIQELVLVVPKKYQNSLIFEDGLEIILKKINLKTIVVTGGSTRNESVRNGFAKLLNTDVVLIHDANRPFLTKNFSMRISKAISKISKKNCGFIPVLKIADSIISIDKSNFISEYLDRNQFRQIQTPQIFSFKVLQRAFAIDKQTHWGDEGSLLKSQKIFLNTFEGDYKNQKITFATEYELKNWKRN